MAKEYGRWRIVRSLDEGGQAHLFVVEDSQREHPGQFALKRLLRGSRLDRFKREVEVLRDLGDPRILKVIDADTEGAPAYFVTRFHEAGSLERANVSGWSLAERLAFFSQVAEAVGVVHAKGIVHRDIKPANILVDDSRRPVIADFGICYIDSGETKTATGEIVGPRHYIAPELEEGGEPSVTPAADVYSLGKVLYWLLTGDHLPREKHREGALSLVARLGQSRYEVMSRLLDKSVTATPGARFRNASAFSDAFSASLLQVQQSINVPGPGVPQRCVYCGVGHYEQVGPPREHGASDSHSVHQLLGTQPYSDVFVRAACCNTCGNVQLFSVHSRVFQLKANPWR